MRHLCLVDAADVQVMHTCMHFIYRCDEQWFGASCNLTYRILPTQITEHFTQFPLDTSLWFNVAGTQPSEEESSLNSFYFNQVSGLLSYKFL